MTLSRHTPLLALLLAFATIAPQIAAAAVETGAVDAVYRLDAGDKLRITIFNEPSLSGDYAVTAEGNVSFPLIGEIAAKGRTLSEVRETLRKRLGNGYLNDPRVAVEPVNYRPYYILGEVNKPGGYPYSSGLKLEQAVAAAGGYTYRANRGTAFLRRADDAREKRVKLRQQLIHVLPGDTIRIGERYF
ncbi:polysaccharide biosynthesis/export family protein [uncultured Sphingomonas sp.]|uniref:polysaccharide biosynthesis/export family protein n=1 Tax=uncultured Sphingomonas sp. TaxID=158754 RepID=UPI0025ED6F8A|nr:polysaccharide biosynthesis/export family protein [uncultured Sphingomonas sp.]